MIKKLSIISLIFFLSPFFIFAENGFPSFPMAFWGEASLDGQKLAKETEISLFCGNDLVDKIFMPEEGIYAYLDVTKDKLLIGECNKDILFKLSDGTTIKYDGIFQQGSTINKDLNFTKIIPPTPPSPPRTGGGGGGGSFSPPQDLPQDQKEEEVEEEVKGEFIVADTSYILGQILLNITNILKSIQAGVTDGTITTSEANDLLNQLSLIIHSLIRII